MRVDIKSKNQFNVMMQQVLNNKTLPFITGCSINSKNIKTGDIFFPLRGEKFDGHNFIDEAIMNGASLIIAEKKNDQEIQIPNIYVNSVLDTIKNLAKRWRLESNCEIIGITGSNGKTSTKEILSTIISKSKSVMFSKSNYNSTVGNVTCWVILKYAFFVVAQFWYTPETVQRRQRGPEPSPRQDV